MKVTFMILNSSYSIELFHNLNAVSQTVSFYREAVNYLLTPVKDHLAELKEISGSMKRQQFIERLVHTTKARKAVYDFDVCFYKFPSYLRRSAINDAIGAVMSWNTNHENWVKEGCKGNEPKLGTEHDVCPCFYRGNMFQFQEGNTARVKVYVNNDWVWREVKLKNSDVRYLEKRMKQNRTAVISSPVIERRPKGHYFLRFTITESIELSDRPIREKRICAVDLGVNTDAVCSVLDAQGTVLARRFILRGREKDSVRNALHRISVFQKLHGSHDSGRLWSVAKRRNENHAKLVAHDIVEFAEENGCDVIVFEYLDTAGKKRGSKKQRLSMWRHRDIQKTAERLAHRHGMRISRVNAWNTSKLAYDGSGEVKRGKEASGETPYSICRFKDGKWYHSDLNASYNIGARYFIRELIKEVPDIMAEVPDIGSGTRRTLSDLWHINRAMGW